jgi:hypothetical protein
LRPPIPLPSFLLGAHQALSFPFKRRKEETSGGNVKKSEKINSNCLKKLRRLMFNGVETWWDGGKGREANYNNGTSFDPIK